ncbi:MAG TPA: alpha/beta hydrolase [Nocardioidaceae bacterium]|nr:alpha/beta hydrolase [Nocardioidaceae bacterium]
MTNPVGLLEGLTLAPQYGEEVLLHTVRDTHEAIAKRVFGILGPAAAVPRVVHDGIAGSVYAGLGAGLAAGSFALKAAGAGGPRLAPSVQSAIAGVIGDRLRDEDHPMHFEMAVRMRGEDVSADRAALTAAYPRATGRVAVFLHGLCETEAVFNFRAEEHPTYAQTLGADGWTPVFVRFNSGLSIRENGAALASLLQSVLEAWPVPVDRMTLVGHSMGGLVARAATGIGGALDWPARVTDIVCLGTPHLGAPLAMQAMHGGRLLKVLPESAAFGRIIDHRSLGIRDLESVLDLPNADHVRYRLVSAQMKGVAGVLLGDLLVRRGSAYGRSRTSELFPRAEVVHLPDTHHFGLLNHPDVHDKLKEWLA